MGYFQLIRADGSSRRYSLMITMLQNIDREDLETLWKLVKAKHGNTRPEEAYVRVFLGDLKVMFKPDIESDVWRNLQGHKGFLRTIGGIVNTLERLFSPFDGFCHQTFLATRSDVMRNAESDSDDEEDYQIKRNKFRAPIYGPKPAPYLNCNNPDERSLAIQTVTIPFRKISVWKKVVSFRGSLPVSLNQVNWKPDYKGSYTKEEEATGQWRTEIRLTDPYGNVYLQGFTTKKTDRKLSKYHKLWEHTMMRPDHHDPNALDNMKPWKRYCFHKFTMSSCYGKDVTEMKSLDVLNRMGCNGEIDDILRISFTDDELQTKKIIKFRLGGRAHSLTLLEFARRLGLYHADELEEDGFNVYFEGGYDKIQKNDLWLFSMFDDRHQNGKCKVLTEDVVRSLSAPIYCRDLDTITLRDLIDSDGKLIPEDPQPGVPRVGIPRHPRASVQDLYDRIGRMEIRQEAIERMEYRQSYHWDSNLGITDSDTSSYTSSDTKSDASSNDIVSSRGPYAYLLQWYDNRFTESVTEFKFNKRTVCKSKASKKRPSNSKQVPTLQPEFALPLSTVGSVANNERKGKRNVRSDKSKDFPNPLSGFPLRVPIVGSFVDYEGKGKKIVGIDK
ncbi:hypothetical protein Tco_0210880 [Tanacetum coccineum]